MNLSIGIIGVGTISTAFVRGLIAKHGETVDVYLSPRNKEKALALEAEFPQVRALSSNQEVLDRAEWITLSVAPKIAADVLRALQFRPSHKIISFIADLSAKQLTDLIGSTQCQIKIIPLPFIEFGEGPILVYPTSSEVEAIFNPLGELIAVPDENTLDLLVTISALMSPYYAVLSEVLGWGSRNGLPLELADRYTVSFFESLLHRARRTESADLLELWQEMTPGGLNELTTRSLEESNSFSSWSHALDQVLERLRHS